MKKYIPLLLLVVSSLSFSQEMTNEKLNKIFTTVSDTIQGQNGNWQFLIKNITLVCITDIGHNRMRIISPIIQSNKLDESLKTNVLIANFHTAIDVKYAISDDLLWSVFIHPLKELTEAQVIDAVKQVYLANVNFGSTFSSTPLVFPGKKENKEVKPNLEPIKQR